jgi:Domain of unknown function (DUF4345)
MRLARFAVAWSGGLVVFFGALYVLATQRMLGYSELTNPTPTALTDLRVMYGAFQIAPGFFCLASLKRAAWLEPALGLATITFACVPAVRIVGMALDGSVNAFHASALCFEIPTLALAGFAWQGLRRAEPAR